MEKLRGPPFTIWLSGLPCSGKTSIAEKLESKLKEMNYLVARLDGDDTRKGLNSDLAFSPEDRKENLRRVAHVADLFNKKGIFVLASFIAPMEENREMIKSIVGNFNLVFVKCRIEECVRRDVKGMYALAKSGELRGFTGISAPYEEPENADLVLDTENLDIDSCVSKIIDEFFNE